jgi:hypothetical protein
MQNSTQVEITKYHLNGNLEGMNTTEKMGFVNWEDACKWAGSVTMSVECPYVVLEMRDINTGTVANF